MWRRGDFLTACVANRTQVHFLQSKSLSLSTTPCLTLIYPPSAPSIILPHCDQHLTLTPSFYYVPFSFFLSPKFIIGKIPRRPSCAQTYTCIPLQSCQLNSCFLIKSKQPLTELLPCYLTPATHLISLCSPDAQLTQACVILSVSPVHVCVYIFLKVASNDKDLAPLQTQ